MTWAHSRDDSGSGEARFRHRAGWPLSLIRDPSAVAPTATSLCCRQGRVVGGVDADREPVHGVAGPRRAVELLNQLGHPVPEPRGLVLRDARMPNEAPERSVLERRRGLACSHLEVIEVARQLSAGG